MLRAAVQGMRSSSAGAWRLLMACRAAGMGCACGPRDTITELNALARGHICTDGVN